MPYVPPTTNCPTCGGDGIDGSSLCLTCFGVGSLPITSKEALFRKLVFETLADIMDKCNDIFEEVSEA